jgi:HD superfamily phosphodiesterase
MTTFNKIFGFVVYMSAKYNIDESHGLSHSMNVLTFANNIFESEKDRKPYLNSQEHIIYAAAALHDMCDKKYMNEKEGVGEISEFLKESIKYTPEDINAVKAIVTTMSYSTVKKNGFPQLGAFQPCYHIVREADLLSAYDFDRCMIYKMKTQGMTLEDAFIDADDLFQKRVFKHNEDNLFITDYSKNLSKDLELVAHDRIRTWRRLLKIYL